MECIVCTLTSNHCLHRSNRRTLTNTFSPGSHKKWRAPWGLGKALAVNPHYCYVWLWSFLGHNYATRQEQRCVSVLVTVSQHGFSAQIRISVSNLDELGGCMGSWCCSFFFSAAFECFFISIEQRKVMKRCCFSVNIFALFLNPQWAAV